MAKKPKGGTVAAWAVEPTTNNIGNEEGPSTERGRRTRAALIQAAREVFERDGFLDARIADIADGAGVAHGSFYTYFDSKEAVFREVVNALVGDMFSASRTGLTSSDDDPIARIDAANRLYLRAYARNSAMMAILEQVATFNDHFRQLTRDVRKVFVDRAARGIDELQRAGLADSQLDTQIAASQLCGMVEHFAYLWLALGDTVDEELAVATLTRLWANGIGLKTPD